MTDGRRGDGVGVVQEQPQVPQPAHAGLRADRRQPHLHPRVAEGALLGLAGLVVEVDLLVRAAGDALPPAAALVLVHQDNPVLHPLVDRAGGAGGHAGGVQAVLADPRQVEHEGLLVGELDLVFGFAPDLFHDRVQVAVLGGTAQVIVPVRGPGDLGVLPGDQGLGPGHREIVAQRRVHEGLVVVGPRLVVVLELGLDRAGEDPEELLDPAAGLEHQLAALVQRPAAVPLLLVLVAARVPLAGAGFDVVEPDVFGARTVGPGLLAGHGAGVAADAFVQVHDHAHLSHDTHQYCTSWERRRTVATMSRWFPVGPR